MANEVESALKQVAQQIVAYVKGASELVVETRYAQVVSNADAQAGGGAPAVDESDDTSEAIAYARKNSRFAAVTILQLDGDSLAVVPLQQASTGNLSLDTELMEEHQRNVRAASEYRSAILASLVGLLGSRGRLV